jgi:tRNA-binding protein
MIAYHTAKESFTIMEVENQIVYDDFEKIVMRVGTIIKAEVFKEARKPAYKIMIDFGEDGVRKTSAQITQLYSTEEIIGKQVVAVVNFPPKQIAGIKSECLLLGAMNGSEVTLITMDKAVENGLRIG